MSPQLPVEPDHKIAVKINAPDDVMREFSLFSTTRLPLPQHDEPAPPPPPKKRVESKPVLPVEIDEPFEGLPSTPSPVMIVPKTTRIPGVGGVYKTTCEYKGEDYKQGASWQDGCSYVCVCVNGVRNWMRCMDRCPRFNPGPLCTLVTKPNTCCPEVKCGNN
ncbi:uncharacterized protein LOC106168999 [Lingula anatina]|uniref:Uncharacterized protein LOC106168999 n=1 Tax=Lingula anatina TaxID=7574 RepID=A0A1S3J0G2_LINAN|nr:uncharacterized protein LOC106168999 [Lingula anatina]|eukprot:XP_013403736.1 uncharacterized protein LOC106168999 [Lingula anatina]